MAPGRARQLPKNSQPGEVGQSRAVKTEPQSYSSEAQRLDRGPDFAPATGGTGILSPVPQIRQSSLAYHLLASLTFTANTRGKQPIQGLFKGNLMQKILGKSAPVFQEIPGESVSGRRVRYWKWQRVQAKLAGKKTKSGRSLEDARRGGLQILTKKFKELTLQVEAMQKELARHGYTFKVGG